MNVRSLALIITGTSLAAACGGDSEGGAAAKGPAIDELPALLAETQCSLFTECVGPVMELFLAGVDCQTNFERQANAGQFGQLEAAVADGRIEYDAGRVNECLSALEAQGCDAQTLPEPEACKAAIQGTVESGGGCSLDDECVGDAFCKVDGICPGVCSPLLGENSPCDNDEQCADALTCDDALERCVKPGAAGAACGGGVAPDCGIEFFCVGDDEDTATAGECVTTSAHFGAALGAPCSFEGPLCGPGTVCVIAGFTAGGLDAACGQKVGPGAACKLAIPEQCPTGEYCKGTQTDPELVVDGTCAALPRDGEACGAGGFGDACAPYTVCVDGSCRAVQENGGSCSGDEECYSKLCKDDVCVADTPCN